MSASASLSVARKLLASPNVDRHDATMTQWFFRIAGGAALVSTLIAAGVGCRRAELVTGRYWVPSSHESSIPLSRFPELGTASRRQQMHVGEPARIGVCFSGGGTRSAAATLGYLRAMRDLPELSGRVDYLSCVSGGAWAAIPYTFLAPQFSDAQFLGPYLPPEELTRRDFDVVGRPSLAAMISETEMPAWVPAVLIRWPLSWFGLRDDAYFAKQLERCFLAPIGLDGRDRFFAADPEAAHRIAQSTGVPEKDVLVPRAGRPFLIVGGTIRRYDWAPWKWSITTNKRIPLEMTPMYVGTRKSVCLKQGEKLGDTYVEPCLYGAKYVRIDRPAAGEPTSAAGDIDYGEVTATLVGDTTGGNSPRFTLPLMMAVTGSAPAIDWLIERLAFPDLRAWSHLNPPMDDGSNHALARDYSHTDGGHTENTGILPLIARRVPNLIVFVNSPEENAGDGYGLPADVRELFATPHADEAGKKLPEAQHPSKGWRGQTMLPATGLTQLADAVNRAHELGTPPVFLARYRIDPSDVALGDPFDLKIDQPFDVKIAWVFLDKGAWAKHLRPDVAQFVYRDHQFDHFPRFKTFTNNALRLIDMTPAQTNALSHLTSWTLKENAPAIEAFFSAGHEGPSFIAVGQQ